MGLITDIKGIKVGHCSDFDNITGCTVVLFGGSVAGAVDIRGGGTSTRQIDGLQTHHSFGNINAILLTGGSAYGLDASSGVMKYLEEKRIGLKVGSKSVVPSVPTAVIFDLGIGSSKVRPTAEFGYNACKSAKKVFEQGSVGVGTGATIGKYLGINRATKGGLASESRRLPNGAKIGVLVVVNAFGSVYDQREGGKCIAGIRDPKNGIFLNTSDLIEKGVKQTTNTIRNTTLAVVATDAEFSKEQLGRIASIANTGIARVINPCHTISDGDMVFAVSLGNKEAKINDVGIMASELISDSIIKAVKSAAGLGGLPSYSDLF
ncbi:MAG: P1 family peptidase [Candidatus Dadabacteria bacterium]|nr:P1 family peptidase [Candidatus Dadabacteria bacterium]NIS08666.1 P1 family peptidase [Candidatus Dadabacteria bacterium]NIY22041.1 peptidase S58 family protein [Candidatus Dadabacteria bacterium]